MDAMYTAHGYGKD